MVGSELQAEVGFVIWLGRHRRQPRTFPGCASTSPSKSGLGCSAGPLMNPPSTGNIRASTCRIAHDVHFQRGDANGSEGCVNRFDA
jgi:hypothetical protein